MKKKNIYDLLKSFSLLRTKQKFSNLNDFKEYVKKTGRRRNNKWKPKEQE